MCEASKTSQAGCARVKWSRAASSSAGPPRHSPSAARKGKNKPAKVFVKALRSQRKHRCIHSRVPKDKRR